MAARREVANGGGARVAWGAGAPTSGEKNKHEHDVERIDVNPME